MFQFRPRCTSAAPMLAFVLAVGLCPVAWKGILADEPNPQSKPVTVQSLFDGKSLDGWRVVDQTVFEKHGEVKVAEGAIVLATGEPGTAVSYTRPFPKADYEISLEARRLDGSDFFCGITFPVGDSHLSLILGGWGGSVTGISNLDDASAVENETTGHVDFKPRHWHKVRLRVAAGRVLAWVDAEEIVDVRVEDRRLSIWWEQEPVRPFGISTWNTHGELRNIQLKRL